MPTIGRTFDISRSDNASLLLVDLFAGLGVNGTVVTPSELPLDILPDVSRRFLSRSKLRIVTLFVWPHSYQSASRGFGKMTWSIPRTVVLCLRCG